MESNFMDEIDCGNFFEQIDDLIEFPSENELVGGDVVNPGDPNDLLSFWNDTVPEADFLFAGKHGSASSDLTSELFVPYEDIVQLEWLSTFVEDSFSGGGLTVGNNSFNLKKETSCNRYQSSSPVSVLESSSSSSSSSCSPGKTLPRSPNKGGTQRARSKRPRPATFNPRATIQLVSPSSSFVETPKAHVVAPGLLSDAENYAESPQKKKKIKFTLSDNPKEMQPNTPSHSVRKCLHCEITKTPQWRAGPMGPKTLCNACGVRFKSGRLFPEYRPAASPTFVPSLHSNSHKKVAEMRCKLELEPKTAAANPLPVNPELVPTCLP